MCLLCGVHSTLPILTSRHCDHQAVVVLARISIGFKAQLALK
jgi:hypothetical protein